MGERDPIDIFGIRHSEYRHQRMRQGDWPRAGAFDTKFLTLLTERDESDRNTHPAKFVKDRIGAFQAIANEVISRTRLSEWLPNHSELADDVSAMPEMGRHTLSTSYSPDDLREDVIDPKRVMALVSRCLLNIESHALFGGARASGKGLANRSVVSSTQMPERPVDMVGSEAGARLLANSLIEDVADLNRASEHVFSTLQSNLMPGLFDARCGQSFSRRLTGTIVLALPPQLHDVVTSALIARGDGIADIVKWNNPWVNTTQGNDVRITRVQELAYAGAHGQMRSLAYIADRRLLSFDVRYPVLSVFADDEHARLEAEYWLPDRNGVQTHGPLNAIIRYRDWPAPPPNPFQEALDG